MIETFPPETLADLRTFDAEVKDTREPPDDAMRALRVVWARARKGTR